MMCRMVYCKSTQSDLEWGLPVCLAVREGSRILTSGKVPLEKTLSGSVISRCSMRSAGPSKASGNDGVDRLHQETSLAAGTVAHDDKLAADLGHLESHSGRLASASAWGAR